MAEEQSKGLPMTAKWDPEKLQQEVAELQELESRSFVPRAQMLGPSSTSPVERESITATSRGTSAWTASM